MMNLLPRWLNRHPFKPSNTVYRDIKVGRNELCPCGSGKKAKRCCMLLQPLTNTELAKKELEKERKSIIKNVKKQYKELTNGPSN